MKGDQLATRAVGLAGFCTAILVASPVFGYLVPCDVHMMTTEITTCQLCGTSGNPVTCCDTVEKTYVEQLMCEEVTCAPFPCWWLAPPGGGSGDGGGSGGSSGSGGGLDTNNNGIIDCWGYIKPGPEPGLENTQRLGTCFGGVNLAAPEHTGIDIPCSPGTPIYAPCTGAVTQSGPVLGGAVMVTIAGPGAYTCEAGHFMSGTQTSASQAVAGVTIIGQCGDTGTEPGKYHVHVRVTAPGPSDYACPAGWPNDLVVLDPEVVFHEGNCP